MNDTGQSKPDYWLYRLVSHSDVYHSVGRDIADDVGASGLQIW